MKVEKNDKSKVSRGTKLKAAVYTVCAVAVPVVTVVALARPKIPIGWGE